MNADFEPFFGEPIKLPAEDYSLPLYGWPLKIYEQANGKAGRSEVVQALCHVLAAKPVSALELNNNFVVHHDVSVVVSYALVLVEHRKGRLRNGRDASSSEFAEKRSFVDLLKESSS